MNLRMIGLAAVVASTALLPLAASAGPPVPGSPAGPVALLTDDLSGGPADSAPERDSDTATEAVPAPPSRPAPDGGGAASRKTELCGPDVTSRDGVEAQTCVLAEGHETWARTYYRNATGTELLAALSLMGPGGRTVQTHCAVGAGGEPATCETRREPSRGASARYLAVAEFAGAADGGEGEAAGPLLLRSGSGPETVGE
ncbi:hypothetical protein [Streptomyces sp. NPDC088725]|uniref:hypothetical protein n=1 Tax=Streptomyces sp. NPDC088725 TaxID=3365873 RepID=UPI003801E0AA